MHELKYDIDENGCHIVRNCKNPKGYGCVHREGRMQLAHRWQYKQKIGPIPDGMQVCHTCDNPPCINPDHLWLGTNADNHADKTSKGRGANQNVNATHCKRGHEFTEANTRHYRGKRHCRECMRDYMREVRSRS